MSLTEHTEFTEKGVSRADMAGKFLLLRKNLPANSLPSFLSFSVFSVSSVRKNPAFTLIELMIVMVVISIMVGITIPISKYVTLRARQASQKIYIEKIKNALEDYRAAYGEYPITPSTNISGGLPDNYTDVMRHYPDHYATECARTTNSPYVDVVLSTNTVEIIATDQYSYRIDYCLTYPLMLKQQLAGARPFMDFKNVTVAYLVYNPKEQLNVDVFDIERRRKAKGGGVDKVTVQRIYGNPVNRPKAIDPVSQKQWKYISDGITYSLTTNTF